MKKGKILRTVLAVVLVLVFTLAFAACGTTPPASTTTPPPTTPATTTPAPTTPAPTTPATNYPFPSGTPSVSSTPSVSTSYTLGFNNWNTGAEVFDWHQDELVYVTQNVFGSKLNCASDEGSSDGTLKNIQNFCSSGVDGLIMTCNQPSVLPQAADACMQTKTPFALSMFVGNDDQRADLIANNPYFVGSCESDTYGEAYLLGKMALADGNKTAVLIGGNLGDRAIDSRVAGFTQSFVTEGGGTILDTARCASPAEAQDKASAMLSANKNADCLYCMVGDFFDGTYNAMQALGISPNDMTCYLSLCGTQTSQYIKDGIVKDATGGHDLAAHIAACLLINYLDGHPIKDASGNPPQLTVEPFVVDKSNVDQFMSIFFNMTDGQHVLPDNFLKSLTYRYNPDVTYDMYAGFCSNLTLDNLLALHGQ